MSPLALLIVGLALADAPETPATVLAEAQKQVEDARLSDAARTLSQLDRQGNLDPDVLRGELQLSGEVNAQLGRREAALEAFRELLFLEPQTVLDDSWGPKVRLVFGEARDWAVSKGTLHLDRCAPTLHDGKLTGLCAHLGPDPLGLFKEVRFHWVPDGGAQQDARQPALPNAEVHLDLPAASQVSYWLEVVGAREAVFARLGSARQPLVEMEVPPAPILAPAPTLTAAPVVNAPGAAAAALAKPNPEEPRYRPVAYGLLAGGAALLAGGGIFGWEVTQDQAQITGATTSGGLITGISQSQAATIAQTSRTHAAVADTLFGTGAAAVIAGAVVWWLGRPGD